MAKSKPVFPQNEVQLRDLYRTLCVLRYRTKTPDKSSPSYLTLSQMSEITKFSKTYIHNQLNHYFKNVKVENINQGIRTRSKSRQFRKKFSRWNKLPDEVRDYVSNPVTLTSMVGLSLQLRA